MRSLRSVRIDEFFQASLSHNLILSLFGHETRSPAPWQSNVGFTVSTAQGFAQSGTPYYFPRTMPRYLGTHHPYSTYPTQTPSFDNAMVIGARFNPVPLPACHRNHLGPLRRFGRFTRLPVGEIIDSDFNLGWLPGHNPSHSKITSDFGHCPVGSSFLNLHVCTSVVLSPYDEVFRREEAARGLTDWSHMNAELYNVHTTYNRIPRSSFRRNPVVRVRCHPFLPLMELWALYSFWPPM